MKFNIILSLGLLAFSGAANAQGVTRACVNTIGANGSNNCQDVSASAPFPVAPSGYPYLSTPITGNATGSTGAVVASLAAVSKKTTWICGFDVSAIGGTAAVGPITIAGTTGGSLLYEFSSTAAGATLGRTFQPCIPASAVNTAITITTTADGSASEVDVNSWGFQQ